MPLAAPERALPLDIARALVSAARQHAAAADALVQESIRLRKEAVRVRLACLATCARLDSATQHPTPLPSRPPRVRVRATVAPSRGDARPATRVVDVGPRRPAPSRP